MTAAAGITYLDSWKHASAPGPVLRTCDEDGTHHFSHLKHLAKSGKHYIHAVNTPFVPTRPMLIGTAVHAIVLGARPGKPVLRYPGEKRTGNDWKAFLAENPDAEILTIPEWAEAEEIAAAVMAHPIAQAALADARFEVPLAWEDGGIKCSTSGVDIVNNCGAIRDLKTTTNTEPEAWARQAFKMYYPQQMVFYRRGAVANGLDVSKGLYLLGVETKPPFDVVELELTEGMVDFAEKTVSLWLEKLRVYKESNQWPGYAQSSIPFDVPAWMADDEDDDGDV